MKLVPALLAETPEALASQYDRVKHVSPLVHFDVADGTLVPAATPRPEAFPNLLPASEAMWHLMVDEPARVLETCLAAPTNCILVHVEAAGIADVFSKSLAAPVGLVLNPETPLEAIEPYADQIRLVQLMTVVPGRQGNPFLADRLQVVGRIRERWPTLQVAIDGGVNRDTIEVVRRTAPDIVAVGSALTRAADVDVAWNELTGHGGQRDNQGT